MTAKPRGDDTSTFTAPSPPGDVLAAARAHVKRTPLISVAFHHGAGTEMRLLEPGVPLTVGRRSPSDVAISDPALSRTHARFEAARDGLITVEDLGSTNGTWLHGKQITATAIHPGDEVVLGGVVVTVHAFGKAFQSTSGPLPAGEPSGAPVATSPAMRDVLELAARLGVEVLPVILQGETGSGKEVVARFIHGSGPRKGKPMICVNCAAIPASLVESTLFGHQRGAFTGAAEQQKGVFEAADGGTLFLDEIGEMPLPAQAALLRVIETKRLCRVGSTQEIAVDVRIIAATHRDLEAMSEAGAFRADLFYRLSAMVLAIPPLRERPEEIESLARFFLAADARARGLDISPGAMALLRAHRWPGNVRELRNAIERAMIVASGAMITEKDLPSKIRDAKAPSAGSIPPPSLRSPGLPPPGVDEPPSDDSMPPSAPLSGASGELKLRLQEYEARLILDTLLASGWNQTEAAKRLGMPIRTLAYKIKAFAITRPPR